MLLLYKIPKLYIVVSLSLLWLQSCSNQISGDQIKITGRTVLDSIPSGSGLVLKGDTAYILGDDATGVYMLHLQGNSFEKIPVTGLNYTQYHEPKAVKHDFESATSISWNGIDYLVSFGSGSNNVSRDSMLMLNTNDFSDNKIIPLNKFYHQLQIKTNSNSTQWNIEGATVVENSLILFNRGNNLVLKLVVTDFMSFILNDNASFPPVEYHKVSLPFIDTHEARLSGACTLSNGYLLFSASVEDTPDWTKDGPILGSFIGIYSLRENKVINSYKLQNEQGVASKEKIESLDILKKEPGGRISFIALSDNDNGTSTLWQLQLTLPANHL